MVISAIKVGYLRRYRGEDMSSSSHAAPGGIDDSNVPTERGFIYDIPDFCWCGAEVGMMRSSSANNPYHRRYFRCQRAIDEHMDEAFCDEVEKITRRVRLLEERLEEEVKEIKEESVDKTYVDFRLNEEIIRHELKRIDGEENFYHEMRSLEEKRIQAEEMIHEKLSEMEKRWKKKMMSVCVIVVMIVWIMKLM